MNRPGTTKLLAKCSHSYSPGCLYPKVMKFKLRKYQLMR